MSLEYYVYAYVRESDGTPYYIGKGKGNRAYKKHSVSVPKDRTKIVMLETNLSEVGALAIERRLIRWWGRKNIDENGVLRNLTLGGEGASGHKHTEETRKKMSQSLMGKPSPKSEEQRKKISETLKGRPRSFVTSDESKKKMTEAKLAYWEEWRKHNTKKKRVYVRKGRQAQATMAKDSAEKRNKEQATCPHCDKHGQRINMLRWHFDNCKMKVVNNG